MVEPALEAVQFLEGVDVYGAERGDLIAKFRDFLLDRVATKVAELDDGKLKIYLGGWTAYREAKGELPLALAHEQEQAAATAAA